MSSVGAGSEGVTYRAEYRPEVRAPAIPVALKAYRRPSGAAAAWPHDGLWGEISQQRALLSGLPRDGHLVHLREAFVGSFTVVGEPLDAAVEAPVDVPVVVMDWVSGERPDVVLQRSPTTPLVTRLQWIADLASAVAQLHSLSIQHGNAVVHGDVKPSNCLVRDDGRLVLLDLGGAVHSSAAASRRGLHTPAYAAPEVRADPTRARDTAADLFSFGATALALLTGAPAGAAPLNDEDVRGQLRVVLARAPRRVRRRITRAVTDLLQPDPGQRGGGAPRLWSEARDAVRTAKRRRARGIVGTAAAAALTVATGSLHAGMSERAVDEEAQTIRWDLLPDTPPPQLTGIFSAEFPRDDATWTSAAAQPERILGGPEGLQLHAGETPEITVLPAPGVVGTSDEVVSAVADIQSGQGMWGVWCRGSSDGGQDRYRFLLSHAGAVAIFEDVRGPDGAPREAQSKWWWLTGADLHGPVRLSGRCADTTEGVVLTLSVDDKEVLSYKPTLDALGPGLSGIEVLPFSNARGAPLRAVMTEFSQAEAT